LIPRTKKFQEQRKCHLQNSFATIRLQTQASHSTNVEGTLCENAARLGAGGMAARSNRWPEQSNLVKRIGNRRTGWRSR
jgi:hypothetical protein